MPKTTRPRTDLDPRAPILSDCALAATRLPRRGLALVFLIALTLRGTAWFQALSSVPLGQSVLDARFYAEAGAAIVSGDGLARPYFMSPAYTWFVALHLWLFGPDPAWVTATQCVLDSITCVFTAVAAARALGRFAGLSAGLFLALHGTQIFFCLRMLPATLGTFVASLLLLAWIRVETRPRDSEMFVGGMLLGIQALIRANILVFLPLLAGLLWWRSRGGTARLVARRIALLVGGVIVVVLPITVRNIVVGGDVVLLTSNGGVNFYIGNAAGGDGRFVPLNSLPLAPGSFSDLQFEQSVHSYVERAQDKPLMPSQVSAYWVEQSVEWILAHPGEWFVLLLRKAAFFINAFEIPQVDNLYFMSRYVPVLDGPLVHMSRVLWGLGLCGLLWLLRRRPLPLVPLLYFAGFLVSTLLFFVTARYRLPLLPVLAMGAGFALQQFRDLFRMGGGRALAGPALALAICSALTNVNPRLFAGSPHAHASDARARTLFAADPEFLGFAEQHNNMAARWRQVGDGASAERELRAGLRLSPGDPDMHFNLGRVLEERGDHAGARQAYAFSYKTQPENADAARLLGRMMFILGEHEAALPVLEASLRLTPDHPETWNTLAGVRSKLGDLPGVLEAFERASELAPDWTSARYNVARTLVRLGRPQEALASLAALHQSDTENAAFAFAYAEALVESESPAPAGPILDEYLQRYPQDFNALLLMARVECSQGSPGKAKALADRAGALRPEDPRLETLLEEIELAARR